MISESTSSFTIESDTSGSTEDDEDPALSTTPDSLTLPTTPVVLPSSASPTTSSNKFSDLSNLHPSIKDALRAMKIETMTEIQYKTWDASVTGTSDVLGRSRTGSGKTLAFLLPSLERILRRYDNSKTESQNKVKMLIISPTRELAHQIYTTTLLLTSKLGRSHDTKPMYCQVMYGGTPKPLDIQKMQKNVPTIITSTPGRLLDHLKSSMIHGNTPFTEYIKDIDVLVLDEMDLLLDMGFREDIQSIFRYFDSSRRSAQAQPRQTLLFSATLPAGVKDVLRKYVRPNYVVVDCIQDDDPTTHTVSTIDQSHVILPPNKMVAGIVQTILQLMKSNKQHKIIVFFPTTSQVTYFSQVFNVGLGRSVIEIHSGISQGARTNRSDNFRHSKTASVLFTSDVSARGVDYPDVTHVVQVGAASNRETYIHRLGRTGRAGKSGQGLIVLLPNEVDFIRRDLGDIDIPMNVKIQNLLKMDISESDDLENEMNRIQSLTERSMDMKKAAQDVYRSLFGYYAQRLKQMRIPNFEEAIVSLVNGFAKQAGLREIPALSAKVTSQYRLAQHPDLNVQRQWDSGSRNFDVGRGGGGRGGGDTNYRFGSGRQRDGGFRVGTGRDKRNSSRSVYDPPTPPPSSSDWRGYL
jgi:ATP-dependent RNA helicase MSS116